jgi:hypothetical protein
VVLSVTFGFYAGTYRQAVIKTSQFRAAQTAALVRCLVKAPSVRWASEDVPTRVDFE